MLANLPKGITPLVLDQEKVWDLYTKLASIRGVFDDYSSKEKFLRNLCSVNSVWFECTEFPGVLYADDIIWGLSASVHFAFFDCKLRGREELLKETIKFITIVLQLKKVNAFVPAFAEQLQRFIKNKLGFTQEGILRRCSTIDGMLFDMVLFGMTQEEVLYGRVHETTASNTTGITTV